MMRMARALLSLTLVWTALICTALPAEIAKLPEPYQSLAELARGAPPEFTADALLRIVEQWREQGRPADKDARRDLIEEAFRSAAAAGFPVRMQGLAGATGDTASGSLSRAYALKLDALSLESRAVHDMLPLDPANARKLFGEIARPTLAPLTCDDALVYDLSDFYQSLSAVVNGTFTPKERAKDEHLSLLSDYLGQATSPLELAPLVQVILGASLTEQQKQALMARLEALLESMQTDDRSFSAALSALHSLSLAELQTSLEKYRRRNHECASDASQGDKATPPAKKPSTPKLDPYWQSAASKRMLEYGRKLRYSEGRALTDADRSTPEWQQQVADYLNLMSLWSADQENSEADYYHEKCIVLTALIELAPPGPLTDKLLADYVDFVGNSNLYRESPAEWFSEPRALLDRMEPMPAIHAKILDAFRRSGNPVLNLEVALERTLAR